MKRWLTIEFNRVTGFEALPLSEKKIKSPTPTLIRLSEQFVSSYLMKLSGQSIPESNLENLTVIVANITHAFFLRKLGRVKKPHNFDRLFTDTLYRYS